MTSNDQCCPHSSNDVIIVDTCTFWIQGVLTLIIGIFGIFGNTLSCLVLRSKTMMHNNAFSHLLILLALVDSVLVFLAVMDKSIIVAFKVDLGDVYARLFPYFIYPTTNIVLIFSIFLVLSIAFERYLAVCHPYYHRAMSNTQTVTTRVTKLALPALIAAAIVNIPKFFETELTEEADAINQTHLVIHVTDLRKNPDYINYYINWFSLLSTGVCPLKALVCLNASIYRRIAKINRRCKDINNTNNTKTSEVKLLNCARAACVTSESVKPTRIDQELSKKDVRMAFALFSIIIVFIICHLPRVLLNLHEFFMISEIISCGLKFCPPVWFLCSITVSHLLLVLNSSVNLLIYCSVWESFRQRLRCSRGRQSVSSSSPRQENDNPMVKVPRSAISSTSDTIRLKVVYDEGVSTHSKFRVGLSSEIGISVETEL